MSSTIPSITDESTSLSISAEPEAPKTCGKPEGAWVGKSQKVKPRAILLIKLQHFKTKHIKTEIELFGGKPCFEFLKNFKKQTCMFEGLKKIKPNHL